jgi:hypothetical protein
MAAQSLRPDHRKEDILEYFHPSPGRSTFYDWKDRGLVVPASLSKELKGYYKLNATLKRLGLPQSVPVMWGWVVGSDFS